MLTPEHLRYWFAVHLNKMGAKIAVEKADPHESGPPVKVFARRPRQRTDGARLIRPGNRRA